MQVGMMWNVGRSDVECRQEWYGMHVGVVWNVGRSDMECRQEWHEVQFTLIIMDTLHLYVLLVELDMRLSLSQETPPSVSTSCWLIFGRFSLCVYLWSPFFFGFFFSSRMGSQNPKSYTSQQQVLNTYAISAVMKSSKLLCSFLSLKTGYFTG